MIKKILFLLIPFFASAQGYTSYFTGNSTNISTSPTFGVCLMGGATEHDNAMRWLLQKANGGDVVVLRSSGSNGYNNYLYSELGVQVNSVETLVITSVQGAINPYVLDKVANAEMIWFAGGDQWNYVSYFKDNALEDLLNEHINVKNAPIGGTSAGMAILCGKYFNAQNGSVTSSQAMNNPYHPNITLGYDDFLTVPYLQDVITDTHYDNPDRRGRQSTFIARFLNDFNMNVNGIAANEYVAICIDDTGRARIFGEYPAYQEYAFFIQSNCLNTQPIENIQPGMPLTWDFDGQALKVYKVPGTMTGDYSFDLSDWISRNNLGGSWEHWSINAALFNAQNGTSINCNLSISQEVEALQIQLFPNPFSTFFYIKGINSAQIIIFDVQGRKMLEKIITNHEKINLSNLQAGYYLVQLIHNGDVITKRILKR